MSNIGFSEIVLIAILALVFLGPERMPEIGRKLGGFWRQFNSVKRELGRSLQVSNSIESPSKTESQITKTDSQTEKLNDKPAIAEIKNDGKNQSA